jgi:hypothetical protein
MNKLLLTIATCALCNVALAQAHHHAKKAKEAAKDIAK